MNDQFTFWATGYMFGWFSKDMVRRAVITEENPFGYITEEEYQRITGEKF